jgi:hypothetical protein
MKFMMSVGEERIIEISIIHFGNLIPHLLFRMPKISIYKTIVQALSVTVKSGFLA